MNQRLRLAIICVSIFVAIPARSCGPDFPVAVFVLPHGPGGKYLSYAQGHIGILEPGYRTRSLVVAFDYLSHRPLNLAEQQQAVEVDHHFLDGWQAEEEAKQSASPSGFQTWISARSKLGAIDGYTPDTNLEVNHTIAGNQYEYFTNCLDNSFATAAGVLTKLSTSSSPRDPSVTEWARGQDAVFSNCGDVRPYRYVGPGQALPTAPPPPHLPAVLPKSSPAWLQQDRAYQVAAAHFYALDFNAAINGFRAIAADETSPWSVISRYLVARTYIREATLADAPQNLSTPREVPPTDSGPPAKLALAKQELVGMRSDARMAPMLDDIDALLDYVNLRLQPDAQAVALAQRLQNPGTRKFGQSLIDLTWLRTNQVDSSQPGPDHGTKNDPTGMIAWIADVNDLDQTPNALSGEPSPHTSADVAHATADILEHWHTTHATVWLVAALMSAKPSDAATPDLLRAGGAVSPSDPAYMTITYHRLRLMPRNPATRDQLLTVLPIIKQHENPSTVNQFIALDAATAPSLETWLATTGRIPAEVAYGGRSSTDDAASPAVPAPIDVCGTAIAPGTTELFDADAANTFNRDMPLRLLADSAESPTLPNNLRYQVAQAALVRAILLDQPAIARRMTPLLIHCRPAWGPVLAAYNASTTVDDRRLNGLLALMRFASTEPSVRNGEERRNGFATYDSFRQNWWCTTLPQPDGTVDDNPGYQYLYANRTQSKASPARPLFLTSTDIAEAASEVAALEKTPSAPQYFGTQALSWWKLHPSDPHTPDVLGEADRVLRNSCRTDLHYDPTTNKQAGDRNDPNLTANLAHNIFNALHKDYPQSVWAKLYKSWQ